MIDISLVDIVRLSPQHDYLPFDCLDSDLNDFLLSDSKHYLKRLLAVTYLFEYEGITIAFFSVSNDKISAQEFESNRMFKRMFQDLMLDGKKYRSYPAVKIGRFGVHKDFQGKGLGSKLLDYIKGMFITNNRTGCQYITVDAYK
ncbi:MAG: GNAT family N-acetyltransferase, partial [Bacteroidota bacterium]|nr:GNAT family N-acetyltransferase [Bacteroidota bacterium]